LAHDTKDTTVGCVPNHPKYKKMKMKTRDEGFNDKKLIIKGETVREW
jgi:hypothetical protein